MTNNNDNNRITQAELIARAVAFQMMTHRQTRQHNAIGVGRTVSNFEAGQYTARQQPAPEPAPEPVEINSIFARISDAVARLIG